MADSDAREGFVVIYNPETGDPWECPQDAVDYWTGEKGWRKTAPTRKAAEAAKELNS